MPICPRQLLRSVLTAGVLLGVACSPALARTRLDSFCTVQGQQEVKLSGMGLVIGLSGTGDGAKNKGTIQAVRAALFHHNQPILEAEIKNADNVAVVFIEASVPKAGLRRGQKIDGFVSGLWAKSLRGGRLLSAPLTTVGGQTAIALASGAVSLEDPALPNTGKLATGVGLLRDVTTPFVKTSHDKDQHEISVITLLIDPAKGSFGTASEVARAIQDEFGDIAYGRPIARPVTPGAVEVEIPDQYKDQTVEFVAEILEIGIENPHSQARVVLNNREGMVLATGEVGIDPVIITHKNINVEILADTEAPTPWIAVADGQSRQTQQQLKSLLDSLSKLKVPKEDRLAIIRGLHATGKLHAELIEQ